MTRTPASLPRISLLLPTMNRREQFSVALRAVLEDKAAYPDLEIIVIDGAAGDLRVADIVAGHARDVTWYGKGEGRGLYGALNTGLRHATGEYVRMVSDDDVYLPGSIHYFAEYMRDHPEYAAIGGTAVFTSPDGTGTSVLREGREQRIGEISIATYVRSPNLLECLHEALFFRRDLLVRLNGWCDRFTVAGDADLLFRILRRGRSMMILPRALVDVRRTADSLSRRRKFLAGKEPVVSLFIRGHWYIFLLRVCRKVGRFLRIGSR